VDYERALISKIVSTGQLEEVISKGIRSDLFADDDLRDMFEYLSDFARRYNAPPSMEAVKSDKPDFEFAHVTDSLDYIIDRFVVLAKRRLANEMVIELASACNDPQRSEHIDLEFLEVSRKLATLVPSVQVARFSDMEKRIDEYEQRVKDGKKTGVPFGFDRLDELTGGIQPHEFVTVSGFSGLGKSTMLMKIAFNAWVQDYTPLYISLEMEKGAILRKFDAMAADLNYNAMKQLALPEDQIANWRATAAKIRETAKDIPVIDSIRHCTPENVYAEAVRHKPDLVIVDYLSLMRTSRPSRGSSLWQSLTEITQDLKMNARTLGIPIVAAAQTNRAGGKDGAELDNIGYSISVVQDSDIVIGLFADQEMKEKKEMEIRLNKNRDGALGIFRAVWDHEHLDFRDKGPNDMFHRNGVPGEPKEAPRFPTGVKDIAPEDSKPEKSKNDHVLERVLARSRVRPGQEKH
jgi:replicative DNA helicase